MTRSSAALGDIVDRAHARLLERIENGTSAFEVLEDDRYRWIQNDDGTLQSLMDRGSPERLALPYTASMMAALLFIDRPRTVLMLGLGGGSQARFLRHHFADTPIAAWESDRRIIDVARRRFCLREEGDRLRIFNDDARVGVAADGPEADLMLLDLFGADGMPSWVSEHDLHVRWRRRLARHGVAAINLWVRADDEFLRVMDGVQSAYEGRTLVIRVPDSHNLVVLAFNAAPALDFAGLRARAATLAERTGIDFMDLIEAMRESNFSNETGFVL